jgi:prephenate dehydrogenase
VLTPGPDVSATALRLGVWLASACGASPVQMSPDEHDRAVAFTSHLPQLIAYALAAQAGFNERLQPQLVGQGLRDMTRIARSDPGLWVEIASGNHRWVRTALEAFDRRIHSMIAALPDDPATVAPAADQLRVLFEEGVSGASRLPGKHGGTGRSFVAVSVFIPDSPGQLAALFTAVGEAGINIEDVRIAHAPTAPGATVEVFVTPAAVGELRQVLHRAGWPTAT